uniref:Uncharacterized protein n=1 Tax=Panagrellus redivivus TaxID=6233 RepID=A0A7E4V9P0_PANRE
MAALVKAAGPAAPGVHAVELMAGGSLAAKPGGGYAPPPSSRLEAKPCNPSPALLVAEGPSHSCFLDGPMCIMQHRPPPAVRQDNSPPDAR